MTRRFCVSSEMMTLSDRPDAPPDRTGNGGRNLCAGGFRGPLTSATITAI